MDSLIQTLAKEIKTTFSKSTLDESFSTSLNGLLQTVNNIQASDLNIGRDILCNENNAEVIVPIIGIPIFNDENFSIDVFVLQDGVSLPLHDHPRMHSISKIIHGTLRITSYNRRVSSFLDEIKDLPDDIIEAKMENLELNTNFLKPVELHMCKDFTCKDEPSLLTPEEGNFHELRAVNGTAAFLDIIAPVYGISRFCRKYSLIETKDSASKSKMWLSELPNMSKFWYKVIKYTGPKVTV